MKSRGVIPALLLAATTALAVGVLGDWRPRKEAHRPSNKVSGADPGRSALPEALPATAGAGAREAKNTTSEKGDFAKSLLTLNQSANRLDRNEVQQSVLNRLAQSPQALQESSALLKDLSYARERYGDGQARARITAIQVLQTAAALGDREALEETLIHCRNRLVESAERARGQDQDFSDLVTAWILVTGKERVRVNPEILFKLVPFHPSLRRPLVIGFYNAYGYAKAEPHFSPKLSEILKGQSS